MSPLSRMCVSVCVLDYLCPQKLQFFQEEKNREIEALRQRITELEENQRAGGLGDNRLKRRRVQFD